MKFKDSSGSALMELAITLPIYLLLLFGLAEVGKMIISWGTLDHITYNASKLAGTRDIISDPTKEIANVAQYQYQLMPSADAQNITVKYLEAFDTVSVEIRAKLKETTPFGINRLIDNKTSAPNIVAMTAHPTNISEMISLPGSFDCNGNRCSFCQLITCSTH